MEGVAWFTRLFFCRVLIFPLIFIFIRILYKLYKDFIVILCRFKATRKEEKKKVVCLFVCKYFYNRTYIQAATSAIAVGASVNIYRIFIMIKITTKIFYKMDF